MGWCARYIVTVPSQNLTIVSMGTSEGWSDGCWGGYDDSFSIALIWASLAKALEAPADFVQHPDVAKTRVPLPPRARPTRESLIPPGHPSSHQHEAPPPGETWLGSCACACGPGQGYGKCFNVASGSPPPKAGDCSSFKSDPTSFYNRQRDFCPQAGFPVQCNYPADATTDLCTPKDHPRDGNCTQVRRGEGKRRREAVLRKPLTHPALHTPSPPSTFFFSIHLLRFQRAAPCQASRASPLLHARATAASTLDTAARGLTSHAREIHTSPRGWPSETEAEEGDGSAWCIRHCQSVITGIFSFFRN